MAKTTTRFYEYPPTRDIVFVLGAGASAPDGVPLQGALLPYVLSSEVSALADSHLGVLLRDFMLTWFPTFDELCPSLEEVFGFLDVCIRHREDLSEDWPVEALGDVRESLVKCIHYAVHDQRHATPANYRAFWDAVASTNRNTSVLTLNYDSTLEEAFDPLFPHRSLIDYCLPLINYEMPPGIDGFNWWVDPRKPFTQWPDSDTVPMKVLKLHGSLNWKYCRACRGVLLTPWDTAVDLDYGAFVHPRHSGEHPAPDSDLQKCPYCHTRFDTLILPPTHTKNLTHPVVSQIVGEALQEIRRAKRVVFVGYSFPEADVHIRSMFARSMTTRDVVVVDPHLTASSRGRYKSLSPDLVLIEQAFEDVVSSGRIRDLLTVDEEGST